LAHVLDKASILIAIQVRQHPRACVLAGRSPSHHQRIQVGAHLQSKRFQIGVHFAAKDVQIAHGTQGTTGPAQALGQRAHRPSIQIRGEDSQGCSHATRGHPHLVQFFYILPCTRSGFASQHPLKVKRQHFAGRQLHGVSRQNTGRVQFANLSDPFGSEGSLRKAYGLARHDPPQVRLVLGTPCIATSLRPFHEDQGLPLLKPAVSGDGGPALRVV
jgi:hypothetical protein